MNDANEIYMFDKYTAYCKICEWNYVKPFGYAENELWKTHYSELIKNMLHGDIDING